MTTKIPTVPTVDAPPAAAPPPITHLSDLDRARYAEAHHRSDAALSKFRSSARDLEDARAAHVKTAQQYAAIQAEIVATYGLTTEDTIVLESGEIRRSTPAKVQPAKVQPAKVQPATRGAASAKRKRR